MSVSAKPLTGFDPEVVRGDFPILSREVYGKPLTYLDSAASAQKPVQVMNAMQQAAESDYANVHRGLHYLSNASTTRFENARKTVQRFINAAYPEEVIFTAGATDAINLVASSFGKKFIQEGDEIVLSVLEHHSNIVPWHYLREERGAVLKWVPISEDGSIRLEDVEAALSPKTKLIAISHMSNALGTVSPAADIVQLAHARGIKVLLDGCQAAVHLDLDMQALGADFYVFSGHKIYGPTGIGVLYGKRDVLAELPPYRGGGEMIHEVTLDGVTYADLPHRFEAGTPAILEAIGLAAAIDYLDALDREAVAAYEADLLAYATDQLSTINSLKLFGTAPGKGSIISFVMEGAHAHDISTIVDRSGVAIRAGHHCAQPLMKHLGVTSTARASFALYNTRQDVDRLIAALDQARKMLG